MNKNNFKNQGFTLLETLIVTSIIGIIATAVTSTMSAGMSVFEKIQNFQGVRVDALFALEQIETEIKNALNHSEIKFSGYPKQMEFASVVSQIDENGKETMTLGKIKYFLDSSKNALMVLKQNYSQATNNGEINEDNAEVLAKIDDIEFSYFDLDVESGEYGFYETSQKGYNPRGVDIKLFFYENGDKKVLNRKIFIPSGILKEKKPKNKNEV